MCSYRVRGVDGSCAKHLTVESYTGVMLLIFILIINSIPSPPHSFIPCLKPSFSANPSHRSLSFRLQDWLHVFPDCLLIHTHPFHGPVSGTTRVSRYQKGKTNLDFNEAKDSEWQWHQLGHMQICTSLQTNNHASTPLLSFLQTGCPSCRPTNSVKALKAKTVYWYFCAYPFFTF